MNFNRQTSHTLHEEHRANLDLLGRAEQALTRAPRGDGPREPELIKLVVPVFVPAVFSLYFDLFDGLIQTYVFVFLTSLFMKETMGGED